MFDVGKGEFVDGASDVGEAGVVEDLRHNGPGHSPSNKPRSRLTPNRGVVGSGPEPTRDKRGFRSRIGLGASVGLVPLVKWL